MLLGLAACASLAACAFGGSAVSPSGGSPTSASDGSAASRAGEGDEAVGQRDVDLPALRPTVWATNGAVTSGHPLASQAGLRVLRTGGNAVDAAVTMAAVLAVVRPHMNGVGGDAFALVHEAASGRVFGLNASGRSGSAATPEAFAGRGFRTVPARGAASVTVPGAVSGWAAALERFGTLPLAEALAPAIEYAEGGFPVSAKLHADIAEARDLLLQDDDAAAIFLPGGQPPPIGSVLRQPQLAATLRALAEHGPAALYGGDLGRAVAAELRTEGGFVGLDDLASHRANWVEPLSTTYSAGGVDLEVLAMPPNTQGLALLIELNVAGRLDVAGLGVDSADGIHHLVEIVKLAFEERDRHVTDPDFYEAPLGRLLSDDHAAELAGRVDARRAAAAIARGPSAVRRADTVYLTAVDRSGNLVSWIQSLYMSFGSGLVAGDTGIVLQNRGALFTLDVDDVNVVAPRKRTYHTLSPAMVRRDGLPWMAIGTPGGDSQTPTILQVLLRLVHQRLDPQAAVEAPRWRLQPDGTLLIEDAIAASVRRQLEARGHRLQVLPTGRLATFGGLQLIRVADGVIAAAADTRREAYALGW